MQNDERCCGTGTCIIDTAGRCWCGLQWDGTQMSRPTNDTAPTANVDSLTPACPDSATQLANTP